MRKYFSWDIILIAVVIAGLLARTFWIGSIQVAGDSMTPTLQSGDYLVGPKTIPGRLDRGDLVVVDIQGKRVVKRVVGLPGEIVGVVDGQFMVNGDWVDNPGGGPTGEDFLTPTIPAQSYYLLGDQRDNSWDSRDFGPVSKNQVYMVVKYRFGSGFTYFP